MSVRARYRENEISEETYYYWHRRLYQQMAAAAVSFAGILHEVQTGQYSGAAAKISLGGAMVEIYPGADARMIRAIVQALKSC